MSPCAGCCTDPECSCRKECGDYACARHEAEHHAEHAWMARSPYFKRSPEQADQDLRDAGRGHLVKEGR